MAMAIAAAATASSFSACPIGFQIGGAKRGTRLRASRFRCRAHARSGRAGKKERYYGYDLYELLGVENSAPQPEIKKAYRWLQKRCHPDVAGDVGHDMSILLNEAYAILSDSSSRSSYDNVRAEWIQFDGYTGEPLYSKWMGPACEQKAVFVDEVRCIGCLKCALIASNTFAVERSYGRARAVAQWGDTESVIDDAIRACPVDCISWVDRSKLAALEYLMSKQPRYTVNIEPENSPGERAIDVFKSADKFLKKNAEFQAEKENPAQKYRVAASSGIQARAGRWWHFFVGTKHSLSEEDSRIRSSQRAIVPHSWFRSNGAFGKSSFAQGKMKALYDAVTRQRGSTHSQAEEYWEPLKDISTTIERTTPIVTSTPSDKRMSWVRQPSEKQQTVLLMRQTVPLVTSLAAAVLVHLQSMSNSQIFQAAATVEGTHSDRLSLMLQDFASSPGMQPVLAGIIWYVLTSVACGFLALFVDDTQA